MVHQLKTYISVVLRENCHHVYDGPRADTPESERKRETAIGSGSLFCREIIHHLTSKVETDMALTDSTLTALHHLIMTLGVGSVACSPSRTWT